MASVPANDLLLPSDTWYQDRAVVVALVASVVLHLLGILLLPGFRQIKLPEDKPLTV